MIHILYKTTNLITGEYYIGIHSSVDPHDSYLGSGVRIINSIRKYGRSNFKKEILARFHTREEALTKEAEIVNATLLADPKCLNLSVGGASFKKHPPAWNEERRVAMSVRAKQQWQDPEYVALIRKAASESNKGTVLVEVGGQKKRMTREEARANHHPLCLPTPIKGLRWVNNGTEQRRIPKEHMLDPGWSEGRLQTENRYGRRPVIPESIRASICERYLSGAKFQELMVEFGVGAGVVTSALKALPKEVLNAQKARNRSGRGFTPTHRERISAAIKSQPQRVWVCLGNQERRIPLDALETLLSEGWSRGRIIRSKKKEMEF